VTNAGLIKATSGTSIIANVNDDGPGGEYTESWTAKCEPVAAHSLMGRLLRGP